MNICHHEIDVHSIMSYVMEVVYHVCHNMKFKCKIKKYELINTTVNTYAWRMKN